MGACAPRTAPRSWRTRERRLNALTLGGPSAGGRATAKGRRRRTGARRAESLGAWGLRVALWYLMCFYYLLALFCFGPLRSWTESKKCDRFFPLLGFCGKNGHAGSGATARPPRPPQQTRGARDGALPQTDQPLEKHERYRCPCACGLPALWACARVLLVLWTVVYPLTCRASPSPRAMDGER